MHRVPSSWWVASCLALADSLSTWIWNINGGDHQGGTGNGLIVSTGDACLGKVLAKYSKGVITVWLLEEIALRMAALTGWLTGGVCIRVKLCAGPLTLFPRKCPELSFLRPTPIPQTLLSRATQGRPSHEEKQLQDGGLQYDGVQGSRRLVQGQEHDAPRRHPAPPHSRGTHQAEGTRGSPQGRQTRARAG
jgi:hypothetical protein